VGRRMYYHYVPRRVEVLASRKVKVKWKEVHVLRMWISSSSSWVWIMRSTHGTNSNTSGTTNSAAFAAKVTIGVGKLSLVGADLSLILIDHRYFALVVRVRLAHNGDLASNLNITPREFALGG
jgi:hypothetical protein